MSDDVAALLLALATENAELRQQLATAQDMLMETAIDADRKSTRLNSSHSGESRMPSSA